MTGSAETTDPGDPGGDTSAAALLLHPHRAAPEGAFQGLPQRHGLRELRRGPAAQHVV